MRVIAGPRKILGNEYLTSFLNISYQDPNAFSYIRQQVTSKDFPRDELATILKDYNSAIGNDSVALSKIEELKSPNSVCVITGQQLGLMAGPCYTILKGISCLLAAKESQAIPIFWLATEDHDIAEIDHTYFLDSLGNLKYFHLSFPKNGLPVEDLKLHSHNQDVVKKILEFLRMPLNYILTDSYPQTMARLMVHLFAGTGMVFLEPKTLRPFAIPFFRREIEENERIQASLESSTLRLKEAGGVPILTFDGHPNLFLKEEGLYRRKLRKQSGYYIAGNERYSKADLLSLIQNEPQRFSPNVASRPILQSVLLPTLAYIAGPTEVMYHCQLLDYYSIHGAIMPCIIPRIGATLIPPFADIILERSCLKPWQEIPKHWESIWPKLRKEESDLQKNWLDTADAYLGIDMPREILERYIRYNVEKLMRKTCKLRVKKMSIPTYGLHLLQNLLNPHEKPQERVLNWLGFQAHSQLNLIHESLKILSWKQDKHLYLYEI